MASETEVVGPLMDQRIAQFGKRVREERDERSLSLSELSERAGIALGLLSEIERGIGNPSFRTLLKLAYALELPIGTLFGDTTAHDDIVVRRDSRNKLILGDAVYELLSPDRSRRVELLSWTIPPGSPIWDVRNVHKGEETSVIIQGQMIVKVRDQEYRLDTGDTIFIDREIPHSYRNEGDELAVVISCVSPPPRRLIEHSGY